MVSSIESSPVEKSGRDFHRLAVPTKSKSPIRSIPKRGSGTVTLERRMMELMNESDLRDLY